MFYFLCKIITVIKMNKLTYLAYIGIINSACCIMFTNNDSFKRNVIRTSFKNLELC